MRVEAQYGANCERGEEVCVNESNDRNISSIFRDLCRWTDPSGFRVIRRMTVNTINRIHNAWYHYKLGRGEKKKGGGVVFHRGKIA